MFSVLKMPNGKNIKAILLLILGFGQITYCFDIGFSELTEIMRFSRETAVDILESWELIRPHAPGEEDLNFPFVRRSERELRQKIKSVSDKIDRYQERVERSFDDAVTKIMTGLPMKENLEVQFRLFDSYINQIDDLFNLFEKYNTAPNTYERYTLEDFAQTCVSSRQGALPDILKKLHRLIVPPQNQLYENSILIALANQTVEASSQICNDLQSSQQLLYNLYTTVALTELKGYSMIQFSYMLLRMYNNGSNFNEEMTLVKQQYTTRIVETLRAVKTAMAFAPRDLWRCDPRTHELDKTYTELKQLFQGYIVNEVDLNPESTCRENCAYYSYAKVHGCYQNQFCSQQRRCNGKVINCEYVDSDMWICPSGKKDSRRYDYIEYENGNMYGQKSNSCAANKVDSWWRWLFWHCSYCFCYCDDNNSSSDRYFSLRDVIADIANNKVITGVRLIKSNQILHIQIQEGELLPRGSIKNTSLSWKPINEFSILDSDVKSGVDYHVLAWEKRALDLDDLVAPQDHVLTGIRFRLVGPRLNLEIMVTPFNFTTGKLIQPSEKSYWHSNDITDRIELKLENPDIPIRTSLPNVPDSNVNQYLNFAPSDKQKDAAQSTIPFVDIQPVIAQPSIPIAGAGIFHKGRKGSGGFIALKLITYNFAPHLQVDLPPEQPIIESTNAIKAA